MSPNEPPLFAGLERTGRFHQDTALGRVFHPGTRSFRQISPTDSVHISVRPDNHVSVHVDRVSPLAIRDGRPCRYSVARALAHNATVLADAVLRMVRRQRGVQSCHLDCTVVWVPDDEPASKAGADAASLADDQAVA